MNQAANPITPAFGSKIVEGNDITEEEMVEQLEKSYKDAICCRPIRKNFY